MTGVRAEPPAIHLVAPMAGRGTRFGRAGFELPKPLLPLDGRPFFWWATESLRRSVPLASLTFVILEEHEAEFRLGRAILAVYPEARIVSLPAVTAGSLQTAVQGCVGLSDDHWLVLNDCDHAFRAGPVAAALASMPASAQGFLCHFRSRSAAFSYAAYDESGRLLRTVEKQVISDLAIAGAYGFRSASAFLRHAERYAAECPYPELFTSGVFNVMAEAGEEVRGIMLDTHLSFGTPEEYDRAAGRIGELGFAGDAPAVGA